MTGGTDEATDHGPAGDGATNHTPARSANQVFASTRRIGVGEFTTYWSVVPGIGRSCGGPSVTAVKVGPPSSGTVAVCGSEFSIRASRAWGVPATAASTTPAGESGGMRAKSAGRSSLGTKVQGPANVAARYQRPARSR